jgi:hypothetical protein
MRFCQVCGKVNLDDARFCESCGAGLAPVAGASPAGEPAAASAPTLPTTAQGAPVPIAAPRAASSWQAMRARYGSVPVFAVLGVLAVIAASIVYSSFFKPMTASEYTSKALEYAGTLKYATVLELLSSKIEGLSSADPNDRADAKQEWDAFAKEVRTAIAGLRGLRPPAEYGTTHSRLLQGAAAYEKIIGALDPFIAKVSTGRYGDLRDGSNQAYKALPEFKAVETALGDTSFSDATSAFAKAYTKLQEDAGNTGDSP